MNTLTVSKNKTVDFHTMGINEKRTWIQRLKKYFLNNVEWFNASSAMLSGNAAAAVQIMKNVKRC